MQNRDRAVSGVSTLGPWVPVLLWAAVVWTLGGDSFSTDDTSRYIAPLLHWLLPDLDEQATRAAVFWIRRSAHVGEYGLLALLALRAALRSTRLGAPAVRGLAFGLCVLLASADELRQAGSALRTGSPFDVLLDLSGALAMLLGAPLLLRALGLERLFFGPLRSARSPDEI